MTDCDVKIITPHDGRFSLLDDMIIEPGTYEDYERLHHLHYKSENMPVGPKYWRCVLGDELVGVSVSSTASLLLAPRHEMLPNLKPGGDTGISNRYRPAWINKNLRRKARIVTSTMYRGVGVSYRMVNLAMRLEGNRYYEILSSMSKFNPFDLKAGFQRAPLRRSAAYEKGLRFFREWFEAYPSDYEAIMEEFYAQSKPYQAVIHEALAEFYFRHSSKEKTGKNTKRTVEDVMQYDTKRIVKELQQLVFSTTVYGLYENPDFNREMPERLPLSAYDNQATSEPLDLEKL